MTSKRLNFPSMGDAPGESSDTFIQNERGEYERFIPDESNFDEDSNARDFDLDDDRTEDDDTLAGEREAYARVKDLLGSEENRFEYFPSDAGEENNQRLSMAHLQKSWGSAMKRNIGIANFFYKNFLEENSRREAENTGIASHYLMVEGFYNAALEMEKLALKRKRGESEVGKSLKFKGMNDVINKGLENDAREMASRVYYEIKNEIIKRHGGISHGG